MVFDLECSRDVGDDLLSEVRHEVSGRQINKNQSSLGGEVGGGGGEVEAAHLPI